ncbi:MAG TPA: ATP-binding protein [Planctomycetota bacterium]|nr:ATP-binding protein [Planctomycetota bacterium]
MRPAARQRGLETVARAFYAGPVPISVSTQDGARILDVNDAFLRLFGYSREELIGKSAVDAGIWVRPDERRDFGRRVKEEGSLRDLEVRLRKGSGEVFTALASVDPVEIEGEPCVIVSYQDVTERRRLEEELVRTRKMGALGRLAGGVAHDFNNLLTAILGHAALSLRELRPDDPGRPHLEGIQKAAERAAGLTRQLLTISRRQVMQPATLDPSVVLGEMEGLLRHLLGEGIRMELLLDPGVGTLRADRSQLEQVILNLAVNARDAMPGGGRLSIWASNAGDGIRLAVTDTGCGMDRETLSHLFEPFFTTKPPGKGTGLGLATVYGIVTQIGGTIRVESEPGRGTRVEILLPRSGQTVPAAPAPASPPRPSGRESLLLVEDEEAVRSLAREVLRQSGYRVLEARDGPEALRRCAEHDGSIDLLVTDVVMPGMSGSEVAERVRLARPGIKVLYMSGYTDSAVFHHGVRQGETEYLEKPFTPDALARKVRDVLDRQHV